MKKSGIMNRKKHGKRLLYLFFLLAFLLTGIIFIRNYGEEKKQENRFRELEKIEEGQAIEPVLSKFSEESNNPDWIGWLKIEQTSISYPIMQRKGEKEYYLHRDFDGNYSFCGTPFLDSRCTLNSDNCIIYGHNINGGRMFGAFHAYEKEPYYREHPEVKFRAGEENRSYQIVSVVKTTISSPLYSFTDVGNWEEYQSYVKQILSKSLYQTEMGEKIKSKLKDSTKEEFFRHYQFLTMSTCRSWVGKDERLLVIAAKKR